MPSGKIPSETILGLARLASIISKSGSMISKVSHLGAFDVEALAVITKIGKVPHEAISEALPRGGAGVCGSRGDSVHCKVRRPPHAIINEPGCSKFV
jgi:hypothetical protein